MENQTYLLTSATECLVSHGYSIQHAPEIVLSTPWSTVIRFLTTTNAVYLKQTPPSLSLESEIIQLLSEKFHASVPVLIDSNEDQHFFLMKDAGNALRTTLKAKFNIDLLCQSIQQYAAIQRSAEDSLETFLRIGVPDWRLDKLPILYDEMINRTDFLKADGITDNELQLLHDLRPQFLAQCVALSNYGIPETIGIPDFHDNNVLMDPSTKKLTFIDWGETAIIHPFFSLNTCLRQSITHHGVKEADQTYQILQDACYENWLGLAPKNQLEDMFILAKQLWPFYSILGCYRLMMSVNEQALKSFYADRPNRITGFFKEYIQLSR